MPTLVTPLNKLIGRRSLPSEAQRCFQAAIASVADKLVITQSGENDQIQSRLQSLASSLDQDADRARLNATAEQFDEILADYQNAEHHILHRREDTVRETLKVLNRVLHYLRDAQGKQSDDLAAVTHKLESMGRADDLNAIRPELEVEATRIRTSLDALEETRSRIESDLSGHVSWLRQRHDGERMASEDSLTGLTNRREAEAELERQQAEYAVFSILFLDIRNLKAVNHAWGRAAGDQVLKLFANRLKSFSKRSEIVCRWGGEEFLIVLRSSLPLARARSEELKHPLSIPFTIDGRGGQTAITADVHIGVAEYCAGDCIDDLVARAHADMHQQNIHSSAPARGSGRN